MIRTLSPPIRSRLEIVRGAFDGTTFGARWLDLSGTVIPVCCSILRFRNRRFLGRRRRQRQYLSFTIIVILNYRQAPDQVYSCSNLCLFQSAVTSLAGCHRNAAIAGERLRHAASVKPRSWTHRLFACERAMGRNAPGSCWDQPTAQSSSWHPCRCRLRKSPCDRIRERNNPRVR